nr:proline-rich protein 12-like [Aegilops tauschii subsp. strangulata]
MLLLFSSSVGQHQRCKRTLAVARDFQASAALDGPRSRPPVAALAIALGLLPRAAAKPTYASSRAGPRAPPLSLTHTHTLTLTDRIPQSPDPAAAPASYSGRPPPRGPSSPVGQPSPRRPSSPASRPLAPAILPRRSPPRAGPPPPSPDDDGYELYKGLIRKQERLWIGKNTALRTKIISALHDSAVGGHSGATATYQRIKKLFVWDGL